MFVSHINSKHQFETNCLHAIIYFCILDRNTHTLELDFVRQYNKPACTINTYLTLRVGTNNIFFFIILYISIYLACALNHYILREIYVAPHDSSLTSCSPCKYHSQEKRAVFCPVKLSHTGVHHLKQNKLLTINQTGQAPLITDPPPISSTTLSEKERDKMYYMTCDM